MILAGLLVVGSLAVVAVGVYQKVTSPPS